MENNMLILTTTC